MEKSTAKVFITGRRQAVRILKQSRFNTDEVYIEQENEQIILSPKPKSWTQYFAANKQFSDDFPDHIEELTPENGWLD